MDGVIGLIIGIFIGHIIGVFMAALMFAAKDADLHQTTTPPQKSDFDAKYRASATSTNCKNPQKEGEHHE